MGIKTFQSKLFSTLVKPFLSQGWSRYQHPLAGLMVATAAVGVLGAAAPRAQAQTAQAVDPVAAVTTAQSLAQSGAQSGAEGAGESVQPVAQRLLFGQVPQPDQIGQGYVVLERSGDRVYGALYYPSSSFDCFTGQVQGDQLAMTIVDSYAQQPYAYSMALADDTAVASAAGVGELAPFGLDGFYPIETLSANDHRLLDQCRGALAPTR